MLFLKKNALCVLDPGDYLFSVSQQPRISREDEVGVFGTDKKCVVLSNVASSEKALELKDSQGAGSRAKFMRENNILLFLSIAHYCLQLHKNIVGPKLNTIMKNTERKRFFWLYSYYSFSVTRYPSCITDFCIDKGIISYKIFYHIKIDCMHALP